MKKHTITQMLMSNDDKWGFQGVPTILYQADEKKKYGRLIRNYNNFVRAKIARDEEIAKQFENNINDTFVDFGQRIMHGLRW